MSTHRLIDKRASGLSSAEALRLEDHVASCEACHRQADTLTSLSEIVLHVDTSLSPRTRSRVIDAALREANAHVPEKQTGHAWRLSFAFAMCCAVFGVVALREQLSSSRAPRAAIDDRVAQAKHDRVLSGSVQLQGSLAISGARIEDGIELRSAGSARVALAQAHVELRPQTVARWSASTHTLALSEGSVFLDVKPGAKQRFEVQTPSFSVLVLGTRFSVSLDGVSVSHGRVAVRSLDGKTLQELTAGMHWNLPRPAQDERAPAPKAAALPSGDKASAPTHAPSRNGAAWVSEARLHLADKRVHDARKALSTALASTLEPSLRAEAMTLRAECELVEGDASAAIAAYLRVASTYARLPAGENALFAAARLQMQRGQREQADKTLSRYLARYPSGRFVGEARQRLRDLRSALDHAP